MFDNDDTEDFGFGEFSEEEKKELENRERVMRERLEKNPLLIQANEIRSIVDALLESCSEKEMADMYGVTMRESAIIVLAKLTSALHSNNYVLCMQNAALIREHAEYLRLSNHLLNHTDGFDKKYVAMFREEMENFRFLFIDWVKQIREMDSEVADEWGLFVKD